MFLADDRMNLTITQGDTGLLTIAAESNHTFTSQDRAVFTVKKYDRPVLVSKHTPDERGTVQIEFLHDTTECLHPGAYQWDIRYVLDAEINACGHVTGGREVITPMKPATLTIVEAVGEL